LNYVIKRCFCDPEAPCKVFSFASHMHRPIKTTREDTSQTLAQEVNTRPCGIKAVTREHQLCVAEPFLCLINVCGKT